MCYTSTDEVNPDSEEKNNDLLLWGVCVGGILIIVMVLVLLVVAICIYKRCVRSYQTLNTISTVY